MQIDAGPQHLYSSSFLSFSLERLKFSPNWIQNNKEIKLIFIFCLLHRWKWKKQCAIYWDANVEDRFFFFFFFSEAAGKKKVPTSKNVYFLFYAFEIMNEVLEKFKILSVRSARNFFLACKHKLMANWRPLHQQRPVKCDTQTWFRSSASTWRHHVSNGTEMLLHPLHRKVTQNGFFTGRPMSFFDFTSETMLVGSVLFAHRKRFVGTKTAV